MPTSIRLSAKAEQRLDYLAVQTGRTKAFYLRQMIENGLDEDPRALGKALGGPLGTLWRYRIGDYRAICEIQRHAVTVLVIREIHR
jgi:mRNA interferase RelE/StbE